jgi:predicted dehydrogenase
VTVTARTGPVGVAIIGAGVISDQYLKNLTAFPDLRVVGVADIDVARAAAAAEKWGVPVSGDVDTVLGLPDVEIAVNLTIPAAHASVATAALEAGKHVYGEKPLAMDPAEGEKLLALAAAHGLRIGSAPDTFLGAGLQSSLRAIGSGLIGTPIAAATAFQTPGPEIWHPSPEFLFQPGAGPLFDMAPYYLTALVSLLGPATRVAATARRGRAERVIGSGPKAGTVFPVDVPTHVTALIDFKGGPSASSTFSFDSQVYRTLIEITGTEATLSVPDPNSFDGTPRICVRGEREWRDLPVSGPAVGRGMGVLEMARALRADRPHRAAGEMAQHVLETMTAIADSAERGEFRTISSTCDVPEALAAGWDPLEATLGV